MIFTVIGWGFILASHVCYETGLALSKACYHSGVWVIRKGRRK